MLDLAGIERVIVNGETLVERGRLAEARGGRVLRAGGGPAAAR